MHTLALAALFALVSFPALAAGTVVTVPIGTWSASLLEIVAAIAVPVIGWALRFLPGQIQAVIRTAQVDQLLAKAIAYGINTTAGAARDKTLSLDVGNEVVAQALTYAVDAGPRWLEDWLGGKEGVRKRIIARLDVAPEAALK
jgi:opacity protein-like surface antigen